MFGLLFEKTGTLFELYWVNCTLLFSILSSILGFRFFSLCRYTLASIRSTWSSDRAWLLLGFALFTAVGTEGHRGFAFGFVCGPILGFPALLLLRSTCPCLISLFADFPLQFIGLIQLYLGQHCGFLWLEDEEVSPTRKVTPPPSTAHTSPPLYRRRASQFRSLGIGSTPVLVPISPCTSVGSNKVYSGILIVELPVLIFNLYCVVWSVNVIWSTLCFKPAMFGFFFYCRIGYV